MPRRGQCRCGTVLRFEPTSQGYKTRCSVCRSVVRLRLDATDRPSQPHRSSAVVPRPTTAPSPLTTEYDAPDLPDLTASEEPPDFSSLGVNESTAPTASPELETFQNEPAFEPATGGPNWWVLGAVALAIVAAGGAATMLWG